MPTDTTPLIIVMDPDAVAAQATCSLLQERGFRTSSDGWNDPEALVTRLQGEGEDVAVAILGGSPDVISRSVEAIVKRFPAVVPIVLTAYGTVEEAVSIMRKGASDYLIRPVTPEHLVQSIDRAMTRSRLLSRSTSESDGDYGAMVGGDLRMHRVFEVARAVAGTPTTVLMTGESGTGKSMIARAIHQQSPRCDAPFVEISCGSIPETLLESELFGHVKGAFTGAHADKVGKFEAACGGTIFLDEINSAPPAMQMKLLRVLQERVVEPVGSNEPVSVDARVILATNQPLEELVAQGLFRQDLYYRIKVIDISLPPLRERDEDIITLSEHFLAKKGGELARRVIGIDPEACRVLRNYQWPGNVRELENVIERAVVLAGGPVIGVADLPDHLDRRPITSVSPGVQPSVDPELSLREAMEEPERRIILGALEYHDWNRQETAASLEINRTTLYKKMKRYGLDRRVA
ncbi:MAG: sigma-54-dependent Fis family transcriptional regulator [Phycisphaerales bacterium]|nr:sigma-54-dependent Fis family transcriptional regulator [Phycisphaerales bacterium]